MKRILTVFIALWVAQVSMAQYGNQFQYNSYFKTSGAFDYPSELGTDIKTGSINLVGTSFSLGNSMADVNWLYNVATQVETGTIDGSEVPVLRNDDGSAYLLPHVVLDKIIKEGNDEHFLVGGMNVYPPLALAYKLKVGEGEDRKELVTFSFNHRFKTGFSAYLGKNFFNLIYNGNGSFGDNTVNIIDLDIKMHAYSEWSFGMAFPLMEVSGMKIRYGMNMKYLVGYAAFDTEKATVNMTNKDGDEWDFRLDYLFNLALPNSFFDDEEDLDAYQYLKSGIGYGLGFDLGGSIQIKDHLRAYMAVNDLGSIKYSDQGNRNYYNEGEIRFDGFKVNVFGLDSVSLNFDTIVDRYDPDEKFLDFNMPLATRLTLGAEFGLLENETKKGDKYFRHNFHFTYIQGFNKAPGNATRPFINVAYAYERSNVTAGVNTGYGGIYGFNFGGFLGMRFGPFRMALGSNALLSGFFPQSAKGMDITLNMALAR